MIISGVQFVVGVQFHRNCIVFYCVSCAMIAELHSQDVVLHAPFQESLAQYGLEFICVKKMFCIVLLSARIAFVRTRLSIVLVQTLHCTRSFCGSTLTNPPQQLVMSFQPNKSEA